MMRRSYEPLRCRINRVLILRMPWPNQCNPITRIRIVDSNHHTVQLGVACDEHQSKPAS